MVTLLLPFSVNHSIRIAQDCMAKWELVWPKLLERSTLFESKKFHRWLKCGDQWVRVSSMQLSHEDNIHWLAENQKSKNIFIHESQQLGRRSLLLPTSKLPWPSLFHQEWGCRERLYRLGHHLLGVHMVPHYWFFK